MSFFKHLLLAGITFFSMWSCVSDPEVFDVQVQWETEKSMLREYVARNYPKATEHKETGIWYELTEEGRRGSYVYKINQDINPQRLILPVVTVRYTLRLLDSDQIVQEVADEEGMEIKLADAPPEFMLRTFLPRKIGETNTGGLLEDGLQVGAKIRVFTPSLFAYGSQSRPGIPPNSPLFYEIEVLKIEE